MLQFYYLSITFNLLTGFILFFKDSNNLSNNLSSLRDLLHQETTLLLLGAGTFITGFFKLLTVVRDDVPVVGDLLPAIFGLAGGFALLIEYYQKKVSTFSTSNKIVQNIFVNGKKYLGLGCLICAALHFLFPTILFI